MKATLSDVRGQLIAELKGLIASRGVLDIAKNEYRLDISPDEDSISVMMPTGVGEYTPDVVEGLWMRKGDGRDVARSSEIIPWVECWENTTVVSDLYADDLEELVRFVTKITDDSSPRGGRKRRPGSTDRRVSRYAVGTKDPLLPLYKRICKTL